MNLYVEVVTFSFPAIVYGPPDFLAVICASVTTLMCRGLAFALVCAWLVCQFIDLGLFATPPPPRAGLFSYH